MLNKRQRSQLQKIVLQVNKIIAQADAAESRGRKIRHSTASKGRLGLRKSKRVRRGGDEVKQMKREIKTARRKGAKVTDLAAKYGVSPAYIYMMK